MIATSLIVFFIGSSFTACGKRGDTEQPFGAEKGDYPRPYPDPKSY